MLSTLAEDAVRAAAESPFLEAQLAGGATTAVLCVLVFPRHLMIEEGAGGCGAV